MQYGLFDCEFVYSLYHFLDKNMWKYDYIFFIILKDFFLEINQNLAIWSKFVNVEP